MAKTVILLVIVAFGGFTSAQRGDIQRSPTVAECQGKAVDIFFLLDSSTSIWIRHYLQVLQFLSDVISRLDVRADDTRIGALTFSDNFQVGFDLDRFRSKEELLGAIKEETLPYRTGVTNTHLAIRHVRQHAHFRPNVTKVMVVVTDGGSRFPTATREEARLAKEDDGIYMVVVGVGLYQQEEEWKAIASDPDTQFIFNVTDYDLLQALSDRLPRVLCPLPPVVFRGECPVTENADLFFLASRNAVPQAHDVITHLTPSFRPRDRLHVRYVMEVCDDTVDRGFQGLDKHCNRSHDASEQDGVSLMAEVRRAARDMKFARGANQVAVVFVDPRSVINNRIEILGEARRAREHDGITIIVVDVGVGDDDSSYLRALTSDKKNVIKYPGSDNMESLQQLLHRMCESANFSFGPEPEPV